VINEIDFHHNKGPFTWTINGHKVAELDATSFRVYSAIRPFYSGVGAFPLGNDFPHQTYGPADLYIEQLKVCTTSTTALSVGANPSVTVGSLTVKSPLRGTPVSGGTELLTLAASLIIDRGQANEEAVASGNWSVVNGSTLSITCANTHSGTYDIEQIGEIRILANAVSFGGVQPESLASPDVPVALIAGVTQTVIGYIPSSTSTAWPYSGMQWNVPHTGFDGTNKDYVIRHNNAASVIKILNAANTAELIDIDNDGNLLLNAGHQQFWEISDPAAPGANRARVYARDNGSGKTQLVVRFPTGAVQVIATEP
jgi:hypothetical protein